MTMRNEQKQEQIEKIKDAAVTTGLVLLGDVDGMPNPTVRITWAMRTLEAAADQVARLEAQ